MVQSWFNSDKLYLKYGPDKAVAGKAGEYRTFGALHEIELRLDLSTLTSSSTIVDDNVFYPKGAYLEQVVLEVSTAAVSGGSPTLDVGLVQSADRATGITNFTNTGFIAAEVYSGVLDTVGKKITYTIGTSKVGAGVGLAPAQTGMITARLNTATATGTVIVRISYRYNV